MTTANYSCSYTKLYPALRLGWDNCFNGVTKHRAATRRWTLLNHLLQYEEICYDFYCPDYVTQFFKDEIIKTGVKMRLSMVMEVLSGT
jgi:hypothetical protein